jgi:hypothetical protein
MVMSLIRTLPDLSLFCSGPAAATAECSRG